MARVPYAWIGLALAVAACGGPRPPAELSGLWSAGAAACGAGVGVRFGGDAIVAVYDRQTETLFNHPRYTIAGRGEAFRVRIVYQLPHVTGGVRSVGAHGVLVLARQPDGRIAPMAHNLVDARTGAVRTRVSNDPTVSLLTLMPCDDHPWVDDLRGHSEAPTG